MAITYNPFTGNFDNIPSTLRGDNAYTTVNANSASWGTGGGVTGAYLPLSGGTMTGKLTAGYSATEAGINIGQGTVPTDSAIGDLWMQQYTLNWKSPVGIQAAAMTNGANTFNRPQIISLNDNDAALRITQTGTGNSIVVEDSANPDITSFIVNSAGNVGIGVDALFDVGAKLSVVGSISSTDIVYASGGNSNLWNSAYTNLVTNSAAYLSGSDLSFLSVSANWNSVYSNVNANSAQWAIDSTTDTGVRSLTSNWENTYTTVQSNSSTWNYQGSDIRALTAGWVGGNAAYTNLIANSAAYLSGVDLSFLSVSGNWNSVYSNVNANSANWDYQGNDLKSLSSNWDSTYTTVLANSASWAIDSTTDTGVRALTSNWQNTYTTVIGNSATWDYQGTDIKTLTAGWVGGNDAYTNLVANSAAYLSGVDLSFLSVSANWDSVYSNVNANSASWGIDNTTDLAVRALTGNWENTYTTVLANSATWSSPLSSEVLLAQISNADSVTLNRGDVVYTFGATGFVMSVKKASNTSEATSSKTLGIVNDTIVPNGIGYATIAGRIDKLNLGAFNEGDALWLDSTAGNFTNVKAVAPNHLVYLGVVERANNGNGIAYIKVQNGYELNEIHDILITNPQAKDLLQRNSANTLWVNGQLSADGSNITSGTIDAARMPAFSGDITTSVGSTSATVVAIQSNPISVQAPSLGQMLQWTGTSWSPGAIPTGGSGGGGLSYYFNFNTPAQSPTTNLSATPNTPKELGTIGTVLSSSYTTGNLSQTDYDLVCGFVSLTGNPGTTVIPSGLWDFNIWASSTGTTTNQTMLRLFVYKYDGVNQPTLLAQSDDIYIYDPSVTAQYIASVVFPQTTVLLTDRIYVEIRAKATQNNRTITVHFGNGTPSHLHTTLPSVGGTGLVKVVDGVYQTPASLLVDSDVASNASIAQSKINGLTDVTAKTNSTYTTVNSNSANWDSVYSTVQANSAITWNYQGTDLKALSSDWQNTYTTVSVNSAAWSSVYSNVQSNSAAWSLVTSYSTLIGNSTTNPITATHNLDTKDILFSVREVATDKIVYAAGRTIDNNNLELTFNTTPSINQYDLTVLCNGGIAGTSGGTTNNFALVKVTTTSYIQNATYTHNLYDDTTAGGQINVTLLPPAYHVAVTQHKKIGSTANVVLSAPNGTTIDGQTLYTLMNQYESIGIYSDGTNYFIE